MTNDISWPEWHSITHDVAPRNEERLMIAVDVEPQRTSICGQPTPQGLQFRLIYKSQLPLVQKMVQTEEHKRNLAIARAQYEQQLSEETKRLGGDVETARATMAESVESYYHLLPGGKLGRPPLRSLRVHTGTFPAPHTPEAAAAQQAQAHTQSILDLIKAINSSTNKR